jgi:electron transport complex protein RnfA
MENIVFTRALGIGRLFVTDKSPLSAVLFGAVHTFVITVACFMASLISPLLNKTSAKFIEPLIYVLVICVLYIIVYFAVCYYKLQKKESIFAIGKTLALSCFNYAVLGSVMIVTRQSYTPVQALFYGLGCGLGYVIAVFFMEVQHKRIKLSKVPKSFKGMAITLIYIGLISLALYGLLGHKLAA